MCIPLTPAEKAQLENEKTQAQNRIDKYDSIAPARAQQVAEKQLTDDGFKKAFDFYNGIIVAYEAEREELTGEYIDSPITETDILNPANLIESRTTPENPVTDIIRVSEFDGTPLITTANEIAGIPNVEGTTQLDIEPYWIARQAEREDWLVNGFGGTSPTITPTTAVTEAITGQGQFQITVTTTVDTENAVFAVGDTFVLQDGSNQVGVRVDAIVSQVNGDPLAGSCSGETPPGSGVDETTCLANGGTWTPAATFYEAVLDVTVLTTGTVAAGGTIDETWSGFSNSDRTAKVDSTDGYTYMMTEITNEIETLIDARIVKLDAQETALNGNDDPDLAASALTDVQTSQTALAAWKVSKDIDDTELGVLASERATRGAQITARIAAINAAFTGQPSGNFYDLRYTNANDRGNTSRGTLRILKFEEGTDSVIADIRASLVDKISSIDALLANACP